MEALKEALLCGTPEIFNDERQALFNSDQGCQFTGNEFTGVLRGRGIKISTDGKVRVFDNIFVERLWRAVKYEEVYIKSYESVNECRASLAAYF